MWKRGLKNGSGWMLGSQRRQIPWGREDLSAFLTGTRSPDDLHQLDRRGLTPVAYAALEAARVSTNLQPLLALLDPPEAGRTVSLRCLPYWNRSMAD
jgi:hypothetical protein